MRKLIISILAKYEKIVVVVLAFASGLLINPLIVRVRTDLNNLLMDLVPEAIGIVFTVLIIERIYRYHEDRQEKKKLIEELGSRINLVAVSAAEKLWANKWWADGSLKDAQLAHSDLRGVDFGKANLTGVRFSHPRYGNAIFDETSILPDETTWLPTTDLEVFTNPNHKNYWRGYNLRKKTLKGQNFHQANLRGADLRESDLSNATFSQADLRSARLEACKLQGTNFRGALFDVKTLLPDGSLWSDNKDLLRFGAIIDEEKSE